MSEDIVQPTEFGSLKRQDKKDKKGRSKSFSILTNVKNRRSKKDSSISDEGESPNSSPRMESSIESFTSENDSEEGAPSATKHSSSNSHLSKSDEIDPNVEPIEDEKRILFHFSSKKKLEKKTVGVDETSDNQRTIESSKPENTKREKKITKVGDSIELPVLSLLARFLPSNTKSI